MVATQAMYVRVGKAIRRARLEERVSIADLASRVGVSATTLQKIEEGHTSCPLHVLVAVADDLDTTLDSLVPVTIESEEFV